MRRRHFRWSGTRSENNARATRAESAQTVLSISTGHPKTDREPAFGERWSVTTSSKFKA